MRKNSSCFASKFLHALILIFYNIYSLSVVVYCKRASINGRLLDRSLCTKIRALHPLMQVMIHVFSLRVPQPVGVLKAACPFGNVIHHPFLPLWVENPCSWMGYPTLLFDTLIFLH